MILAELDGPIDSGGAAPRRTDSLEISADHGEVSGQPREFHRPVLVQEVLENLNVRSEGTYLDATLGEGGHALEILNATSPGGRLVGLDRDPRSLDEAIRRLEPYAGRFTGVQSNYARMGEVCQSLGIDRVDGVLMDLGFSSRQIEEPGYGLSFQRDEPLDMRFGPEQSLSAADIVNSYPQAELADIIFRFGEERRSRAIARAIVRARPLRTTRELAQVVAGSASGATGSGVRRGSVHPATRTFQALRIAVNDELENLQLGLTEAINVLEPMGRLVVICYHSLEDRIVKTVLAREVATCICPPAAPQCVCDHQPTMKHVTRRVIKPSAEEQRANRRSRSARMRVAQRLG